MQERLVAAFDSRRGARASDRLCETCVEMFAVDAAAISLIFNGTDTGTLGASSPSARVYDELPFTMGEGPSVDSVAQRAPVLVSDLADRAEVRWPAYTPAMLGHGIHGVFAVPVVVAGDYVGALNLFCRRPGPLGSEELAGAELAAELASISFLDLIAEDMDAAIGDPDSDAWAQLAALSRIEVSQATGMLIAQLDVTAAEAMVRLRAHAYLTGASATEVARAILDDGLLLEVDQ